MTDRQADRETDTGQQQRLCLRIALRSKKCDGLVTQSFLGQSVEKCELLSSTSKTSNMVI